MVEQPEFFPEQEGAVEAVVGPADLVQLGELTDGLVLGRLEQAPARVLDPASFGGVGAVVAVPFVSADPVGGAAGEPADMEGVEGDLGAGYGFADRLLI